MGPHKVRGPQKGREQQKLPEPQKVQGPHKVLHVIGGGEFGGAEEHLLTLAGHLNPREFELHTACLFAAPLAAILQERGFPAHVFPMRDKADLSVAGKVARLIRDGDFRLVHTHGVRANLIGRLAARRAGTAPVVTTVHSVLSFDYPRALDRWVNAASERLTRGMTQCFVAVSQTLREHLISQGIPPEKVVVIHNGLELEKYKPDLDGEPVRRQLGISRDKTVIGVVARLHPVKGHIYLLQAFSRLAGERPDLVLVLVGSGTEKERLMDEAERLGIADRVVFTGFRKDIPNVMAAFDLAVLPSLSEGQGFAVLEAMAMKKPVLASRVGGVPELVKHGQNGWLVPPADADALAEGIRILTKDRDRARRLGEAGRETVEKNFTAALMAQKTADLYKWLLGGRR